MGITVAVQGQPPSWPPPALPSRGQDAAQGTQAGLAGAARQRRRREVAKAEARRAAHLAGAGERRRVCRLRSAGQPRRRRLRSDGDAEAFSALTRCGVKTNRDDVVYDFQPRRSSQIAFDEFIEDYNAEVDRYQRAGGKGEHRRFRPLREDQVERDAEGEPAARTVRGVRRSARFGTCLYRPFCKRYLCFDRILNEEGTSIPQIFPTRRRAENTRDRGERHRLPSKPFMRAWSRRASSDIHSVRAWMPHQCFPFYVYDEDGTQPPREHHRLGPEALPRALRQQEDHEVGHLLLRLRPVAPSGLPPAVRREPEARTAADSAGPRLPRLRHGRREAGPAAPGL